MSCDEPFQKAQHDNTCSKIVYMNTDQLLSHANHFPVGDKHCWPQLLKCSPHVELAFWTILWAGSWGLLLLSSAPQAAVPWCTLVLVKVLFTIWVQCSNPILISDPIQLQAKETTLRVSAEQPFLLLYPKVGSAGSSSQTPLTSN